MKRDFISEKGLEFIRLPDDVHYEIQSKLQIVSFRNVGITCTYLHRLQRPFRELKQKEVYTECIERIYQNLKERNLLTIVQKLIAQFGGVLEGNIIRLFLWHSSIPHPFDMTISKRFELEDVYRYLQENMDTSDYTIMYGLDRGVSDYKRVCISATSIFYKVNLNIIQDASEDIIDDYTKKLPHTEAKIMTDLNCIYYRRFWELLGFIE